jgi:hypothetical protein
MSYNQNSLLIHGILYNMKKHIKLVAEFKIHFWITINYKMLSYPTYVTYY